MKHVLLLGGYARAGKTTAIHFLERLGVVAFSTSAFLHSVAQRLCEFEAPDHGFPIFPLYHAEKEDQRDFLIFLAEQVIVPSYGRENGILLPVLEAMENRLIRTDTQCVVLETIGGEEFEIIESFLRKLPYITYSCVNIRRESELSGVDSRVLLPGEDIRNDGTLTSLNISLIEYLESLPGWRERDES